MGKLGKIRCESGGDGEVFGFSVDFLSFSVEWEICISPPLRGPALPGSPDE